MKSILFLVAGLSLAQAFVVVPACVSHRHPTLVNMSDEPMDLQQQQQPQQDDNNDRRMGETERLLVQRKQYKDSGLVQELGRTVRKDGLDGLRALIWAMFNVSNYVFPAMGAAMSLGLLLNMAGYGYFFDDGSLVIDTLANIQQEAMFQEEAAKLASGAIEAASMF